MANETTFWFTTHNPKVGSAMFDTNIYVRPEDESRVPIPHTGDRVLIYEQAAGEVDGKLARGGRGGIIASAEVLADGWKPRETTSEFKNEAICGNHDYEGFVPLDAIGPALGHKGGFPIRGLNGGTGLLPIGENGYLELLRIFKSHPRR